MMYNSSSYRYKCFPFVSVIDGELKIGTTNKTKITVQYEPNRTRANVEHTPQIVPVTVNGKRYARRFSAIKQEYDL